MTREQAITAYHEALLAAVTESQAVLQAQRQMEAIGLRVEELEIQAVISVACQNCASAITDEQFLKNLRIDPNLKESTP